MKKAVLIIGLIAFSQVVNAQNVTKDANGNFQALSVPTQSKDVRTGQTYTDADGKVFEVWQGARGGLFVWKVRTKGENVGQAYKFYLKTEPTN